MENIDDKSERKPYKSNGFETKKDSPTIKKALPPSYPKKDRKTFESKRFDTPDTSNH